MSGASKPLHDAKAGACPVCGQPTTAKLAPFCSARCSNADLGRWLTGSYAIPSTGVDDDEDGDDSHAARGASTDGQERNRADD
jgi:endogenous inhibitor of DNA gyrase (YacG/DUF329 family)